MLSIPPFKLPQNAGIADAKEFRKLVARLEKLTGSVGTNSRWFQTRCKEISRLGRSGESVEAMLVVPRDSRVVLHLWEHEDAFLSQVPPTRQTLEKLRRLAGGFRAGHLSSLTEVYFRRFDQIPQYSALMETIAEALRALPQRRLSPNLRQLAAHIDVVFHSRSPEIIGKAAREDRKSFRAFVSQLGVPVERPGRFMEACKNEYYIQTVQALEPGTMDNVLGEILSQDVKESPYDRNLCLGQKVAAVMIDKCARLSQGMPENWLDIVISIMGDPRRGHRTPAYQKWWAPMSDSRVALVRKWLAGADLRLFLEILEDSSNDADLQRMYPDRKAFLEGLLEHYKVEDARLFLGQSAVSYIARKFSRDAIRSHGKLRDPHKTVIHVQVEGIHLFEGTHNYAARVGRHLPEGSRVLNYSQKSFTYAELTSELEFDLLKAARGQGRRGASARIVHSTPLTWQHKLIEELGRLGLRVHPEHVLTSAQYRAYRSKYGING